MTDTDGFIDEVSEELRRDRLFAAMRRWGWAGVAAVLLVVGGAAYNEWTKAAARAEARALGDALSAAVDAAAPADRAAAFAAIGEAGGGNAVLARLISAAALMREDPDSAVGALRAVADDAEAPDAYRHLAALKLVMAEGPAAPAEERLARLEPLLSPGAPYRVLAEEQRALILVERARTDEALEILRALASDQEAPAGLRGRAARLIVALGGAARRGNVGN